MHHKVIARIKFASAFVYSVMALSLMSLLFSGCSSDTASKIGDSDIENSTPIASDNFKLPIEDGSDSALTFTGASIEEGNLVVYLAAAYEGIEPTGSPLLLIDDREIAGRKIIHSNNDVDVIFDGVDQIYGTVVLENVNLTEKVDISAHTGDGSFVFPDGVEVTFSSADVVIGGGEARLLFSTSTPTSTAISLATISSNGATVSLRGSGVTYSAKGQVLNTEIRFPAEAESLLQDPDSVLRISEVRRMVRYEIPL